MPQESTHIPYKIASVEAPKPLPELSLTALAGGAAMVVMGGQLPGIFGAAAAFAGGALAIGAPALTLARTLVAGPK